MKDGTARLSDLYRVGRLFRRFLAGQRRTFLMAFGLLLLESVTQVFEPYPLAYLVDYLRADRATTKALDLPGVALSAQTETVLILTAFILLLAMLNSAADSLAEIYLARGGRMLGFELRLALYAHLQRLSLAFHDQRRTGDTLTRVTGDVTALEEFVVKSVSDFAGSLLLLTGTLIFMLVKSWQVAALAVLVIPILAWISNHFSQRIKEAARIQRAREGDLASTAQEMLSAIRVVQAYGQADADQGRFAVQNQRNLQVALKAAGIQAWFSWVVAIFAAAAISGVVWVGLWLIERDAITIGTLVLFILLTRNMFKPTRKIIREWNAVGKVYASVERIAELLDRVPAVSDAPDAEEAAPFRGHVTFRDVTFGYRSEDGTPSGETDDDGSARPALAAVSFSVEPGKVLALVGHSGAGKSTVAQLIPRLYDPDAGAVLIDGRDIRRYTLSSLRAQISMVMQDTVLFSGTVADNIAYGRKDASREQIITAARQANAHEFIERLPDGYNTLLGERGSNLSGGQRQRIAIARAIIRNTPVLILDEPTTGLDAESSQLVLAALRTLLAGKTTIMISHDLNLIRTADEILVVADGRIVERGVHRTLLEAGGLYADLYHRRFAGAEAQGNVGVAEPSAALACEPAAIAPHASEMRPARTLPRPGTAPALLADGAQLELLRSSALQGMLPALPTAFDHEAMRSRLQTALFGAQPTDYTIERCTPGKATYLAEAGCLLRYELEVKDNVSGQVLTPLVNARILPSQPAFEAYVRDRLAPLATLMRGREEIAPFATPVAMLDELNMALGVFPIDGELPMLVGATDRKRMRAVFRETLADRSVAEVCRVDRGRYGRQHRCVLRYQVEGRRSSGGETERWVIYGKVAADGRGMIVGEAVEALRHVQDRSGSYQINIPRFLGYAPGLQLVLLEAIPGQAQMSRLLKAPLRREAGATPETLTLEQALDTCARIADALHSSGIKLGHCRTLDDELADLRPGVCAVQELSTDFGAWLHALLDRLEAYARESQPLPLCFSHGDFTYTQFVFDGVIGGLVDFDTICQAEPALDLGRFLAYLRLAVLKAQKTGADTDTMRGERLCAQFLNTYIAVSGYQSSEAERLRARVSVYEIVSLLRIALHSWRRLKGGRLEHVIALLEERTSCLP